MTDKPKFHKCLHCQFTNAELIKTQVVQLEEEVNNSDTTDAALKTAGSVFGDFFWCNAAALADEGKEEIQQEATNEMVNMILGHVVGAALGFGVGTALSFAIRRLSKNSSNQQKNYIYKCPKCKEESIVRAFS